MVFRLPWETLNSFDVYVHTTFTAGPTELGPANRHLFWANNGGISFRISYICRLHNNMSFLIHKVLVVGTSGFPSRIQG